MTKSEKVDFDNLINPFDSNTDLVITESEIVSVVNNPERLSELDEEDLYLLIVKIYKKLNENPELREKYEKSLEGIIKK